MEKGIKHCFFKILSSLKIPRLLHKYAYNNEISIIMYHGVNQNRLDFFDWCMLDAESFSEQINYIKNNFQVIPLSDVALASKKKNTGKPIAAITFDDGYQNNFDVAYPILKAANIPATIFLTTNFIDTDKTIWTGQLYHIFNCTKKHSLTWRGSYIRFENNSAKLDALSTIKAQLKNDTQTNIETEVANIAALLEVEDITIEKDNPYRMLDSASITKMQTSGLIEFGAHTANHKILSKLNEQEQAIEIAESIQKVSLVTGQQCQFFAYPNGTPADFNDETKKIVGEAKITAAVTTIEGMYTPGTSHLEWPRFNIGADMDMNTFKMRVHGTTSKLKLFNFLQIDPTSTGHNHHNSKLANTQHVNSQMIILTGANTNIPRNDDGTELTHIAFTFQKVIGDTIKKAKECGYTPVVYDLGSLGIGVPFKVEDKQFIEKGHYEREVIKGYKSKSLFKPAMVKDCISTHNKLTVYLDGDAQLCDAIDEINTDDYDIGVTLRDRSELEEDWHAALFSIVKFVNAGVIFFNPTPGTMAFIDNWEVLTEEVGNDQMALNKLTCQDEYPEPYSIANLNGVRVKYFPCSIYNNYYFNERLDPGIKILHFKGIVRHYYPLDWKTRIYSRYFAPARKRAAKLKNSLMGNEN